MANDTPSAKRQSPSKKLRFEVFKRDSFTCQYCGRKAPDVILHVDHIHPRAKGGKNNILNLITSCVDCNSGKFDRLISDDAVLERQRKQLAELQERKEQLEMMFEWQRSLLDLDEQTRSQLADFWYELVPGFSLNEAGEKDLRALQRKFGIEEVLTSMRIASEQYLKTDDAGKLTVDSVNEAWSKIGGICTCRKRERENPDLNRIYYIRGILKRRLSYVDYQGSIQLMKQAYEAGVSLEELQDIAQRATGWSRWYGAVELAIAEADEDC